MVSCFPNNYFLKKNSVWMGHSRSDSKFWPAAYHPCHGQLHSFWYRSRCPKTSFNLLTIWCTPTHGLLPLRIKLAAFWLQVQHATSCTATGFRLDCIAIQTYKLILFACRSVWHQHFGLPQFTLFIWSLDFALQSSLTVFSSFLRSFLQGHYFA